MVKTKNKKAKESKGNASSLTHINRGQAQMVDVSGKKDTARVAVAMGKIYLQKETLQKIVNNKITKGEVLSVARLAGIFAAKKTAELIPLCHNILLSSVEIDFKINSQNKSTKNPPAITCTAKAISTGNTGVEMEAMTAVSVALLTIYDMAKAIDRFMQISSITLLEKSGGKSGHWINPNFGDENN